METGLAVFCPSWVYSSVCALTAQRYLSEETGLEAFCGKYAEELQKYYSDVNDQMVLATAEGYLRHLMEAEVEDAADILNSYAHHRITVDRNGSPRKIKGYFSSALAGVKAPEVNAEADAKSFKPFIFMYRSKPELAAPAGWDWSKIEDGEWLKDFPELEVSVFDGL